jgi:hypothetical protein
MFSSNQILDITGSLDQITSALNFAMAYSGELNHFSDAEQKRGCKIVFQITEDGKYCIGWGFEEVPSGWTEYQFKPDSKIISAIIEQRLKKIPSEEDDLDDFDGSCERGFRMRQIDSHTYGVKNPSYGIIYFEPYICFYQMSP